MEAHKVSQLFQNWHLGECQFCAFIGRSDIALYVHYQTQHYEKEYGGCPFCNMKVEYMEKCFGHHLVLQHQDIVWMDVKKKEGSPLPPTASLVKKMEEIQMEPRSLEKEVKQICARNQVF